MLHAMTPAALENDVVSHLTNCAAIDQFIVQAPSLCLQNPGTSFYECPQCRRIHLHQAGGICTDCLSPLGQPQSLTGHQIASDYYSYLATQSGDVFRLNCEELTGQTNKADGRTRQRLFQDIILPGTENPQTDPIDLLSVTTTMEAGVDIGGLLGRHDGKYAAYALQLSAARRTGGPPRRCSFCRDDPLPRPQS